MITSKELLRVFNTPPYLREVYLDLVASFYNYWH